MANARFFINYSDSNTINKNVVPYYYNNLEKVPIEIVEPCDMMKPTILLGSQFFDFKNPNFLEIDTFGRFYFIDNVTLLNNGIVMLECSIDVLYTYKSYINGLQCLVERQEIEFNGLMPDELIIPRIDRVTRQKHIGTVGGNATGTHICITVTGGN